MSDESRAFSSVDRLLHQGRAAKNEPSEKDLERPLITIDLTSDAFSSGVMNTVAIDLMYTHISLAVLAGGYTLQQMVQNKHHDNDVGKVLEMDAIEHF